MNSHRQYFFEAKIEIIGINPFVFVPNEILESLFKDAEKNKGHIPIKGRINDNAYKQTLVRYKGEWRLYINTVMLKNSPKRIGELVSLSVYFDTVSRLIEIPAEFEKALEGNQTANSVFKQLSVSRQQEIIRYLAKLKSKETLEKNIQKAINFLLGNGRFVGRDKF